MSEPVVRFLVILTSVSITAAVASPLDSIMSMVSERVLSAEPDLIQIEERHARHWQAESESLSETSRRVQFRFDGVPGDFTPAWSVEHRRSDIEGERDGFAFVGTGQEDTLGFGFNTPNQHRLLLGPDRFEWQQADQANRYTIGWVSPRQRRSLGVTRDSEHWQADFKRPAEELYLTILRENQALHLAYGDQQRWSLAYKHGRFGFEVERDTERWPVLTDEWESEQVSLRRFELDHHRLAGHYRTENGMVDAFGFALQHWQADTQAILPYEDMPGSIQASGQLKTHDLWLDLANEGWRSRWLLRHAEPEGSGAHYPIYFPGLGERWPEPDMDYALLAGLRLDYARELGSAARLEVWAQQWWPFYVARSDTSAGSSGGEGGAGGEGGSGGAEPGGSQGAGHDFGGFLFGIRLRLP